MPWSTHMKGQRVTASPRCSAASTTKNSLYWARTGSRSSSNESEQDCQSTKIAAAAADVRPRVELRRQERARRLRIGAVLDDQEVARVVPGRRRNEGGTPGLGLGKRIPLELRLCCLLHAHRALLEPVRVPGSLPLVTHRELGYSIRNAIGGPGRFSDRWWYRYRRRRRPALRCRRRIRGRNGRRAEPLEAVAEETGAVAVRGDVANEAHVKAAVGTAVERFGGLDIVVNNAGVGWANWQQTLDANLTGAKVVCSEALPHLVERRGSVVNVASVSGYVASAGSPEYSGKQGGAHHADPLARVELRAARGAGERGLPRLGPRHPWAIPPWMRSPSSRESTGNARMSSRPGSSRFVVRATRTRLPAACLFLASTRSLVRHRRKLGS